MGRRLAEATKACRTRRTRGETGLRFLLLVVDATDFFLAGIFFVEVGVAALFVGAFFGVALFDAVLFAGAFAAGDGASPGSSEDWDWAAADDKEPSEKRNKVPAKNATAKLRTKALPTAESWRP
jgi:hypothetical protein